MKAKKDTEHCCTRVNPRGLQWHWYTGLGNLLLWSRQCVSLCTWIVQQKHSRSLCSWHHTLPHHLILFLCRAGHRFVKMWNRHEMGHSECYCLLATESSGWAKWPSIKWIEQSALQFLKYSHCGRNSLKTITHRSSAWESYSLLPQCWSSAAVILTAGPTASSTGGYILLRHNLTCSIEDCSRRSFCLSEFFCR